MLKRPKYNTHLLPEEKSPQLYSNFIRMFSPPGGTVMDPFGGPLTTSIACIETNRKCISMDREGNLMRFALGRLRVYLTPEVTMAQLDDFTE